jgi:hypothetical protein
MLGDEDELERALSDLDSEGWNVHAVFQRASWYRLRHFMCIFREEVLELSVRPLGFETADKLR